MSDGGSLPNCCSWRRPVLKGGKGLPETSRELHRHPDPEKTSILLVARLGIMPLAPDTLARRTTRTDLILIPGIGETTSSGNPKEFYSTPLLPFSVSSLNILLLFFLPDKNKREDDDDIRTRTDDTRGHHHPDVISTLCFGVGTPQ